MEEGATRMIRKEAGRERMGYDEEEGGGVGWGPSPRLSVCKLYRSRLGRRRARRPLGLAPAPAHSQPDADSGKRLITICTHGAPRVAQLK